MWGGGDGLDEHLPEDDSDSVSGGDVEDDAADVRWSEVLLIGSATAEGQRYHHCGKQAY